MRIAVFVNSIKFKELSSDTMQVFLFDVENNIITAVGENIIPMHNPNYVCLHLIAKLVEVVYIEHITDNMKTVIERAGIIVKPLDDIKNNPFLHALLI